MFALYTTFTQKPDSAVEHFPLMSHLIGSHRWCQCLLCVYSAPAWEISHQATTWTQAWWVDSVVTEPGPHLKLICLAVENNDDVIGNLAPCVKYGEGIWLSSLNTIPKPFSPQISDSVCVKFPEIPSWDHWSNVAAARIPALCPFFLVQNTLVCLDGSTL